MKFKKPIVFLVALLMLFVSTPAAAAESKNTVTVIEAECLVPDVTIQVVVPTDSKVYVNPQSLPVKIDSNISESQIVCEPLCIENQSEAPLSVSVSVIGVIKEGSSMLLGSSSTQDTTLTSKRAFIYFEMQAVDSDDMDQVNWDSAYDATKHIYVSTRARTKKNFWTIGASGKAGCYGAFRLAGDCVANPKTEWTPADGVDVKVTFTFKAVPNE